MHEGVINMMFRLYVDDAGQPQLELKSENEI